MTRSLLTKLSVVAAATMLTLSPALAGSPGKSYHSHGYGHSHGKYSKYDYKKHKHVRGRHAHRTHRHWKPRFFSWKYANKPYRGW